MYDLRACSRRHAWVALGLVLSICPIAFGADTKPVAVQKVLTGLKNPRGVAVRPDIAGDSCEIFVAESGAGRVIKVFSDKPEKPIDIVSGFSSKPAADDNLQSAGVQSVMFLDHMRIVVAGGDDDSSPFVRLYELPEPASPLTVDQHKQEVNVAESDKEPKLDAHVFRGMARTQPNDRVGDVLLVPAWRDHEPAGLVYIPVRSGTLGDAVPVRLKNADAEFGFGGIAVGNSGYVVVAGESGRDSNQSSTLAFFSPLDRRIVMQIPTDLRRIVALAYSPKTGNLYAANFPTTDDAHAGVYRIDASDKPSATACIAVKIADAPRPTALAFAPDGTLFVTSVGDSTGAKPDAGAPLKLIGDL